MSMLCVLLGHRWRVIALSDRSDRLQDIHPMAGMLASCRRCNLIWDDLPGPRPNRSGRA